jgi:nucleolar protein 14
MSLEERMLERFTRERQRTSKGAMFNLEDEEELTHYGQSLSKFDDFEDAGMLGDNDDEDRGMNRATPPHNPLLTSCRPNRCGDGEEGPFRRFQ